MPQDADIMILGGLMVSVEFTVNRAEPDVGIFSDWIDDFEITHVKRKGNKWAKIKGTKFARALENKISLDTVQEAIDEAGY